MDVAIIGGGAAGMMAALSAAENGSRVTLLERQPRVGKKLLVTGNGRCNLSNTDMSAAHYHGRDGSFAEKVLSQFDVTATLDFFRALGLLTVCESSGRVYPLSDHANSVLDVLRLALEQTGTEQLTGFEVTSVTPKRTGVFLLRSAERQLTADKVVVCCGGLAGTRAGGGAGGYELLQSLGHSRTQLYPCLVQIKTDGAFVRALKGIRADAAITLRRGDTVLAKSAGELQFADYGVSGPAVFELSRAAATASGALTLHIDLLRDFSPAEITDILRGRRQAAQNLNIDNLLTGVLHNRLGRVILKQAGYTLTASVRTLSDGDLRAITAACKDLALNVEGTLGFDSAQVTAGGILTAEFDPATLQSKIVPGLYAAGEVLDVDGDCGGYNLQWAWSSGHLAGQTRQ